MRLPLLFAALAMLAPVPATARDPVAATVPAGADVTLRYAAMGKTLTIEADGSGNLRAELAGTVTLIRRDGVDYVVLQTPAGPQVGELDALIAMVRAQMSGPGAPTPPAGQAFDFVLTQGDAETVGGVSGTLWQFGPRTENGKDGTLLDIVVSNDPRLVPVGDWFRPTVGKMLWVMPLVLGQAGNFEPRLTELLAKGTPIRVGPVLALDSVSGADVAASRFDLPGPVLDAAAFFEAIDPSTAAKALPPLP